MAVIQWAGMRWDYDKHEIWADGIVHVVGVVSAVIGVVALVALAAQIANPWELTAVLVYAGGLLTVLTVSALYNLWPVSPLKWTLRRFDHSAIFLLIAGTYTPFISQMKGSDATLLLVGIWAMAALGIALKLTFPGRFDRLAILLYLGISWSGVAAYETVFGALPPSTIWLLGVGGIVYTTGIIFHLWESLRFQNAVWHAFVLIAAACHYGAVLDCLVLARMSFAA